MPTDLLLPYLMRYIHIASAITLIGAPIFIRFALLPAAHASLDPDSQKKLADAINNRWRHIVYLLITLFLISGLYTFFVPVRVNGILISSRWRDFDDADKKLYHMLFGFKVLAALIIFFLASALAGRSRAFEPIRKKRKTFLSLLILSAALLLVCSTWLRYLPTTPNPLPATTTLSP